MPPSIVHLKDLNSFLFIESPLIQFPEHFSELDKLKILNLGGTGISGVSESIYKLKNLEGLFLWGTKIEKIPPPVLQLINLKELSFKSCPVKEVPEEISRLKKLQYFSIGNTKVQKLPDTIQELRHLKMFDAGGTKISLIPAGIAKLKDLEYLNFANTDIKTLPYGLTKLGKLKRLFIGNTKIKEVPKFIWKLISLRELYLEGLSDPISDEIENLENLVKIDLSNSNIKFLPQGIFNLANLQHLNLEKTPIKSIGEKITNLTNLQVINVKDTKLEDPPLEIASQGIEAIRNYFVELEKGADQLYESKLLILGEGGAGKTSLCRKILNPEYVLKSEERTTEGIDINVYYFPIDNGRDFRMNIWDFGGQEIYHATHQFFLTKRSLYVLLEDTRTEDTDFNYWLQAIELLSDNSPVIIVQNEKQDRKRALNEAGLRGRFSNLIQIMSVNLLTNRGVPELLNRIRSEIRQLPHIGEKLPKGWVRIRQELKELSKDNNYIGLKEYLEICQKHGLVTRDRALFLSDYLHDLGIFLHFQDNPILKHTVILRPEWGSDAVYKVLDNPKVRDERMGRFSKRDLKNIWCEERYAGMQDELLELMMKFELCYQVGKTDEFIAPQLLSANQPDYSWDEQGNLVVRYDYDFMPKGIMTRFIVRRHSMIKSQRLAWKDGVILEREGAEAEVIETYGKRDIRIRVCGQNRKELLTLIMDEFDRIHKSYPKVKVDKLIPCNCDECRDKLEPYLFKYTDLRKAKEKGVITLRCMDSFEEVLIQSLIDEYFDIDEIWKLSNVQSGLLKSFLEVGFSNVQVGNKGISKLKSSLESSKLIAFISYSYQDETLKEKLLKSIKPLNRLGQIEAWDDRRIKPGTEWRKEIQEKLESADIIFLLVSPDFLASDFCNDVEMKQALKMHEAGRAVVVPIILRPCLWEDMPFGKLQALPGNGKAISSWKNEDEAFLEVAKRVKKLIEGM